MAQTMPVTRGVGGPRRGRRRARTGAATLDYVLVLAIVLPLVGFVLRVAPRIMNLVYEMTSVLVSWPFL